MTMIPLMDRTLPTVPAVLDELGIDTITSICGVRRKSVHNWKARHKFPAKTYKVLKRELANRRLSAPDDLWGME